MHNAIPVSNAPSSGAIQANSMNLIYKGDGTKLMRNITHLLQRTHSTCTEKKEKEELSHKSMHKHKIHHLCLNY